MKRVPRRIGLIRQLWQQTPRIHQELHAALDQADEQSPQQFFPHIFRLLDVLQQFLLPEGEVPEVVDYEELPPEQVNLSLPQLVVVFRKTLKALQEDASPAIQRRALEILNSYLIELQGLYDLVFVRRFMDEPSASVLPLSLSALEDHHKRYFRCFQCTERALEKLQQDGLPEAVLRKLKTLDTNRVMTEEQLITALTELFGESHNDQYRFLVMKHTQKLHHVTTDRLMREYQGIQFVDLMNVSALHHVRAAFLHALPKLAACKVKETLQRIPRCQRIQEPDEITTFDELQHFFQQHPLTESAKFGIAFHRHVMRIFDILGTRGVLKWGRPMFELLVLGTWLQTVKDHIVPGTNRPDWQAEHLEFSQNSQPEVRNSDVGPGTISLSSAFFMQPRVKFGLERFLIFKLRTMTVGDIVRVTEFGNWMRKNSPDEFLQFFNIALGDMGGLGIRTMPEHEIIEDDATLWLYSALMTFVPGGVTSPGSTEMRRQSYRLTKKEQLLHELRFYDPRFKRSSSLYHDIKAALGSMLVLNKGRVGKVLQQTESFEVMKITPASLEALHADGVPEDVVSSMRPFENQKFAGPEDLLQHLEEHLGSDAMANYKHTILKCAVKETRGRGY